MNESNAALAEQFRRNDPVAFSKLFGRYHSLVFNRCLRLLQHRQDAEDATQETFSRMAKYINRWDPGKPLEPWLIAIAGNRCRTYLSRRRRLESLSQTSEPVSELSEQEQAAASLREEVGLAMSRLPEKQRLAFQMFHEQSMGYEQIADELNCPVGTVKTWVHRARTSLMQQLTHRDVINNQRDVVNDQSRRSNQPEQVGTKSKASS